MHVMQPKFLLMLFEMYFNPVNAENFRESVDKTISLSLESEVEAYDHDPYLPIETISLLL